MPVSYRNPDNVHQPAGPYSHLAIGESGKVAVIAGQVAVDPDGNFVGAADVGAQLGQVVSNLMAILDDLGAEPSDILELRTFLVGEENLPAFRQARDRVYAEHLSPPYPPSTLLVVAGLAAPELKVELAATVLVPD